MAILTCPKCKNKTREFDIHADTVTCSHCLYDINIPKQLAADLPRDHKVSKSNKGVIVKQLSWFLEPKKVLLHSLTIDYNEFSE